MNQHLRGRDSYIQQIPKIDELGETLGTKQYRFNDVLDRLYFLNVSIGQTSTYLVRWLELEE